MKSYCSTAVAVALLAGCASSSKNVDAAYVSPSAYQDLECVDLVRERDSLRAEVARVAKSQDDKAGGDAAAVAVATLVFLPAALFLAAGQDKSGELSRLKGEFDAVTDVAVEKDCIAAEEIAREKAEAEAKAKALAEERKKQRAGLGGS